MIYNEKYFIECSENEIEKIDGGLAIGGVVGGILGGTVGLLAGTVATIATGDTSGKTLWKWTVACGLSGGAIGLVTPI